MNDLVTISAASDSLAREWDEAINAVRDLAKYESNWDGEDADAVDEELIFTALAWLQQCRDEQIVPPPGTVNPLPDGTIMMEWYFSHDGSGISAQIVIPGYVEIVVRPSRRDPHPEPYPVKRVVDHYLEGLVNNGIDLLGIEAQTSDDNNYFLAA